MDTVATTSVFLFSFTKKPQSFVLSVVPSDPEVSLRLCSFHHCHVFSNILLFSGAVAV